MYKIVYTCLSLFLSLVLSLIILKFTLPLGQERSEFLYLADIVETQTRGKNTQTEQVMALTDWLSENVKEAHPYPPWFDRSSVAKVIQGGIGNCGFQTDNIMTLSEYLGVTERRRWVWESTKYPEVAKRFEEITGELLDHAIAELKVDGKWTIFDPHWAQYIEYEGGLSSLQTALHKPDLVKHPLFKRFIEATARYPFLVELWPFAKAPSTPKPFGDYSYKIYKTFGKYPTTLLLYGEAYTKYTIVLSIVIFSVFLFCFGKIRQYA